MRDRPGGSREAYSAFLSYSHRDQPVAVRLAGRLERYRLPRTIARRLGYRRLKPVFRDRDELTASHDLSLAVHDAIGRSDYLIVVCTPNTPGSRWVGWEIDHFRALRGDAHILSAIFDGARESFHPQLTQARDGTVIEPLAADFTPAGDGDRLGLLKLVAVLAGVRLDDLIRRDAQRRMVRIVVVAIAALAIVAGLAAATVVTVRARDAAAAERARATDSIDYQLTRLRAKAKARGSLEFAEAVNQGVEQFYRSGGARLDTVAARLQWAQLLQARAEDDEKRGDLAKAARHAAAAYTATAALRRDHGGDDRVTFGHAQSAYWLALVAWRAGDIATAERGFRQYAALADVLVRHDPRNPDWRAEQGYANSNLGMLALREAKNWTLAATRLNAAQRALRVAAAAKHDDPDLRYEIADGEAWLADVERLRGDVTAARAHRLAQRDILRALLRDDPANALYRTSLVANQLGFARIVARDHPDAALADLEQARLAIADLQRSDPSNASVMRQKRAVDLFLVETWLRLPPNRRPGDAAIARLLTCDADWRVQRGEELAAFCSLLAARHDVMSGRSDAARISLARPRVAAALSTSALSPRWRLNFAAERAALERTMGPR